MERWLTLLRANNKKFDSFRIMLGRGVGLAAVVLVAVFLIMAHSGEAYADIASGTSGSCSWVIDDDGVLTIFPTDGVSGQLASVSGRGLWFRYREQITKVEVSQGVKAGVVSQYLFFGFSNCTEIDVQSLDTSSVTNMYYMFGGCSSVTSLDLSNFDTSAVTDMAGIFDGCSSLAELNLSGFDTSAVTNMTCMFYECGSVTSLDLSDFDTSAVTNMWGMFNGCSSLVSLDISNFNTSATTSMNELFANCNSLTEVSLGEDFRFNGNTSPASVLPSNAIAGYTANWMRIDETAGPMSAVELRDNWDANASVWAGVWVREPAPTKYTLSFQAPAGTVGSMANQKIVAESAGTIEKCKFRTLGYNFDHWEVVGSSPVVSYNDMAQIPANTYAAGSTITLNAVFVPANNSATMNNGEFTFTLRGGEKATFPNIPAGTAYQVFEETPDGWVLVDSSNESGTIGPLEDSAAMFLNQYQQGVTTASIFGTVTLDWKAAVNGAFKFKLTNEDDEIIGIINNASGGMLKFDPIRYTEQGEYVYTMEQIPGNDSNIDYDRHVETITVQVEEDDTGNLHASVIYDADNARFNNRTRPGALTVHKETENATEASKDSTFYFKITFTNPDGTLAEGNAYSWYVTDENGQPVATNDELVTVSIVGNTETVSYDGEDHYVSGFTYSAETESGGSVPNSLITVAVKPDKLAVAGGTEAGMYMMNLTAEDFSVTSSVYKNIAVEYEDGWISIVNGST